jgi:hypothetical protein
VPRRPKINGIGAWRRLRLCTPDRNARNGGRAPAR